MEKNSSSLTGNCQQYYSDIIKIALAIAVIRSKPQHLSAKVYSQVLATTVGQQNERSWKIKAETLGEELFLMKEELLQVKLLHNAPELVANNDPIFTNRDVTTMNSQESLTMDYLTPPCSTEMKNEHENSEKMNKHVKFLKSILAVKDATLTAEMLSNNEMWSSFISTVIHAVSVLRDNINNQYYVNTSIPECCIDSLIAILDIELPNKYSLEATENVLEYTEEMIEAVMNSTNCENNVLQEKFSAMITKLASHKKTTEKILLKLIEIVRCFSITLRTVSQDPILLDENLDKYNNMYYILWSIESILSQKNDLSVSSSLMVSLEEAVLHLSNSFPLFTHYVWRIGGLLSRDNQCSIH